MYLQLHQIQILYLSGMGKTSWFVGQAPCGRPTSDLSVSREDARSNIDEVGEQAIDVVGEVESLHLFFQGSILRWEGIGTEGIRVHYQASLVRPLHVVSVLLYDRLRWSIPSAQVAMLSSPCFVHILAYAQLALINWMSGIFVPNACSFCSAAGSKHWMKILAPCLS